VSADVLALLGPVPFGVDEAGALEAMQGEIQRPGVDLEGIVRIRANHLPNAEPVLRFRA